MFCSTSHAQTPTAVISPPSAPPSVPLRAQRSTVESATGRYISMVDEPERQNSESTGLATENALKNCEIVTREVEGKPAQPPFMLAIAVEDSTHKSPLLPAEDKTGNTAKEAIMAIDGDSAFSSELNGHASAGDIFSEVLQTLNPGKVYSHYAAQHDDTLKKFAARVLWNGAAGTISADALDYINQAKGAAAIISAMVAIGIVDGLYSCGKHINEHQQQPDNILRILGYSTYKCISPVMNLLPETFCQCVRKAYFYGSLTGASATLLADFLSHLSTFVMTPSAASYITGYACPILLFALTSAGGMVGIISAYKNYKKNTARQPVSSGFI